MVRRALGQVQTFRDLFTLVVVSSVLILHHSNEAVAGHRYDSNGNRTWSGFSRGAPRDQTRDQTTQRKHQAAKEQHHNWEVGVRSSLDHAARPQPINERQRALLERFSEKRKSEAAGLSKGEEKNRKAEHKRLKESLGLARKDEERLQAEKKTQTAQAKEDLSHQAAERSVREASSALNARDRNGGPAVISTMNPISGLVQASQEARSAGREQERKKVGFSEARTRFMKAYPNPQQSHEH